MGRKAYLGLAGFLTLASVGTAGAADCDEYYTDYEIVNGIAETYASYGYDVPAGAITLSILDDGTRVLIIEATAGRDDLEEILFLGFMGGGLAAACGEKRVDLVIVRATITFKDNEVYAFGASGLDCIKLFDDKVSWEYFLNNYLLAM